MTESNAAGEIALPLLTVFLSERDEACPACGYNLRGLTGERCPECGERLVLKVGAAELRQKWVIAGLIGLAMGAGFSGLLVLYLSIQLEIHGWRSQWEATFAEVTGGGLVIEGIALWVWLRSWRRIRRASLAVRVVLALAAWGLTVVNLLVFSFEIR